MSVSPQALESMVLDPLTGVSAAGTLAIVALGLTEIEIVIFDSNEFSAVNLGWRGLASCASAAKAALAGSWESNPTLHKKAKVKITSIGVVAGGSGVFIYDMSGKKLGEFYAAGLGVGVCELFKEFKVNNLNPLSLTNEGGRGQAEGTNMSDFFVIDDPIYGHKRAPLIEDFESSDGDLIHFGGEFNSLLPGEELDMKVVQTSRQLMDASMENNEFIYWQPYGFLYHDKNLETKGFGSDGGVVAVLEGGPELGIDSLHFAF